MFSDYASLNVDLRTRFKLTQVGMSQSVFDQRDLHPPRFDVVYGEADTVDGDRSVQNERRLERGRNEKINQLSVGFAPDRGDDADAVDVSLDDVATEPVSKAHRALQIYSGSFFPTVDSSPLEGRGYCRGLEPALTKLPDGKAGPVDGDALAAAKIRVGSANAQLASGIRLPHARYLANLLDQSGEHSSLSQRIYRHNVLAQLSASNDWKVRQPLPRFSLGTFEWAKCAGSECDR